MTIGVEKENGDSYNIDIRGEGVEFVTSNVYSLWLENNEYVGAISKDDWHFEGDLPEFEYRQVIDFLMRFDERDWEL